MARHRTSQVPPAVDTIRFDHKPHGGIPSIRTCVRLSDDPSDHTSDELHGGIEPPTRAPTKAVGSRQSCSRLRIPSEPLSGFDHLVFTGGWRETLFMSHNDDDIPL